MSRPLSCRPLARSRRRAALAFLAALALALPLEAADFAIVQTLFLPSEYYVGDQVEVRLVVRTPFADALVAPATMPECSWGKIDHIVIARDQDEPEIRIKFTAFNPGIRTLPAINLGPVVLEKVNVFVSSLLTAGNTELAPPQDTALLPGTVLLLIIQSLIFLSLPVGLWFFLAKGRPLFRLVWNRYREGLPYRRISRSLAAMAAGMEHMDARTFYIQVLQETRMYLSDRLRMPALSATTSELDTALRRHVHSPDAVNHVMQVFRHGDLVKFAKEPASLGVRMNELHQLEASLKHIEQEEKIRRRSLETPQGPAGGAHVDL